MMHYKKKGWTNEAKVIKSSFGLVDSEGVLLEMSEVVKIGWTKMA